MTSQNQNEISSEEMAIQDVNSEYLGIPRYLLMENAGSQIASYCSTLLTKKDAKIAIFCGTGGNGGDGFVAARHLHSSFSVEVFITGNEMKIKSKPALKNFLSLKKLPSIKVTKINDSEEVKTIDLTKFDLIIDGLLGTGLKSNTIRQPLKGLIQAINSRTNTETLVVAIDVPSGLKKDGTLAEDYVKATHTLALHQAKTGTFKKGGEVVVKPIGIPPESSLYTGPGLFTLYPHRSNNSHKGQNGKILIIGGSNTYHGSLVLAGKAAFSLNIDLVFMITPEKISTVIRSHDYRFIVKTYTQDYLTPQVIKELALPMLPEVDAILIGPGLGHAEDTLQAVKLFLKSIPDDKSLIIDADALKACKGEELPKDTIVTPHAGEFAILTGEKFTGKESLDEKRAKIKKATAQYKQPICWVVKGPVDIIKQQSKELLNFAGTPAMTTGGTGDILAGLVTAMRSQVKNSFYAATMACFLIGKAGEFAEKDKFTLETLLENIPVVIKEITNFINEQDNQLVEN